MTVTPIGYAGRRPGAGTRRFATSGPSTALSILAVPAPRDRTAGRTTVHVEVVIPAPGDDEALRDVLDGLVEMARRLGDVSVSTRVTAGPEVEPEPEPEPATVQLFPRARHVTVDGRPVALSYTEFNLLTHLVRHPGRVFRREELLDAVWGGRSSGARTVDVHVRRLRVKVGDVVTTVPCVGYRLADDASIAIMRR